MNLQGGAAKVNLLGLVGLLPSYNLYRAVDEHGQVVDVLLRERRNLASAQAFFRRARATAETEPAAVVTDHHQPYITAAQQNLPGSQHIRTGLHRLAGEATKPIERSPVPLTPVRQLKSASRAAVKAGSRGPEGGSSVSRPSSCLGLACEMTETS